MMTSTKRFVLGVAALATVLATAPAGATIKHSVVDLVVEQSGKFTGYVKILNNGGAQRCVNVTVAGGNNANAGLTGSGTQRVNGMDEWSFKFTGQLTNPAADGTVRYTVAYSKSEPQPGPSLLAADCQVPADSVFFLQQVLVPHDVPGVYSVSIKLSGSNEVPATPAVADGIGLLTINTNTNTIIYHIMHSVVNPTASHIHGPAARDKNAGVIIAFPSAVSPMDGTLSFLETNQAAIVTGKAYINIHSGAFPGGEIRGQIPNAPADEGGKVPGSSGWGMIALALGLLGGGAAFALRRGHSMA